MAEIITGFYGSGPYGTSYYGGTEKRPSIIQNRIYFLVNNNIEEVSTTTITSNSTAFGIFGNIRKNKLGSGDISIVGNYTGTTDSIVHIKIVNTGTGTGEVSGTSSASPHFQVSIDNGLTWDTNGGLFYAATASGTDNPTILTDLGISIYWQNGVFGNSFVVDDLFSFSADAQYTSQNLLDWSTRNFWIAKATELVNIDIDFGQSGVRVNAFAIRGLNFLYGQSNYINLYASSQHFDTWTNTATEKIKYPCTLSADGMNAGMVLQEGTVEYRYWRIELIPVAGIVPQATHFFLGEALQLTRDMDKNYGYTQQSYVSESKLSTGQVFSSVHGSRDSLSSTFSLLQESDKVKIESFWQTTHPIGHPVRPFYVVDLPSDPSAFIYSVFNQNTSNLKYQTRHRMTWDVKFSEAF